MVELGKWLGYDEVIGAQHIEENIMNVANIGLVAFIEQHGGCLVLQDNDTEFLVQCNAVDKDGKAFDLVETIPATRQAVRDWLGY